MLTDPQANPRQINYLCGCHSQSSLLCLSHVHNIWALVMVLTSVGTDREAGKGQILRLKLATPKIGQRVSAEKDEREG